jgi:hypothetical protein
MKKDLNYYLDLLRMDVKEFNQLPDTTWEVNYKKLPNVIGKGIGVPDADRDLQNRAAEWITKALADGLAVFGETEKKTRTVHPVKPRYCPFCGGGNITVDICAGEAFVGCADCDYELSVGDVDFEKNTPVENQAKRLWNKMRPIEDKMVERIFELQHYIDILEGVSNGK